jgi:hypothetical protein
LKNKMLCSSKSNNLSGGEMLVGLRRLIGQKILSIQLDRATNDLKIQFERDMSLMLFADFGDEYEGDNYSVFGPGLVWTVGPRGKLHMESR